MDDADRRDYVERYERRLREHGHSPLALGWGKPGREHVRFGVMAEVVRRVGAESVLDVGCGFADFHDHLRAAGWAGSYHGIDLVPGLLEAARERVPGIDVEESDIESYLLGREQEFDAVVASGVFNARLRVGDNEAHVTRSLTRMFELSRLAVCADFMTSQVDYRNEDAWHADPAWALELARGLSRRYELRHDYMPFEFALVVYREDTHPGNVFVPHSGTP